MKIKSAIAAKLSILPAVLLSFLATPSLQAGGYLEFQNGEPAAWVGSTITVNLDQGTLGRLSNTQADEFALEALQGWDSTNLQTSGLTTNIGPDIPFDVVGTNVGNLDSLSSQFAVPIVYDTDGGVTAEFVGAGNVDFVIGFASPGEPDVDGNISDGFVVMNGTLLDGVGAEISEIEYQGAIRHEFGHLLNLDHAQFNDSFANANNLTNFPTMYPFVHDSTFTLAEDDIAWISDIYPSDDFTQNFSTFTGRVVRNTNNGTPINGVNVVARLINEPTTAISCVSGFNGIVGEYKIPLTRPAEQYVIDIEPIRLAFTDGSSVGPSEDPLDLFEVGVSEYLNDEAFESNGDVASITTTFEAASAGGSQDLPDFILNTTAIPFVVMENDGGANFPGDAQSLTPAPGSKTVINGSINGAENGNYVVNFAEGMDDYEDWYRISLNQGLEIQRITLTPTTDQDIIITDVNGDILDFSTTGGTAVEIIDNFTSTDLLPGGVLYIGISNFIGELQGTYELEIHTAVSDNDFVAVTSLEGEIPGVLTVRGRGFSNIQTPQVLIANPNVLVTGVNFVSSEQLQVNVQTTVPFSDPITIQVSNSNFAGGFGGRLVTNLLAGSSDQTDLWIFE